ncbi:MAG: hypothetical protein LBO69_09580 [Ignavibacteria bacterium]|jgi:hypothetical protein|nr:hypothetical protein [Ignavibacteria bacterium]
MKKLINILLLASIFIAILACMSPKDISNNEQNNAIIGEEQIAFITFKIYKDAAKNTNAIQILNKNIVAGSFKKDESDAINYDNYLDFQIYENGKLVGSIKIEHPLYKFVEYFDDNEFQSSIIKLDEQDFFIRLPIKSNLIQIIIIEKLQDNAPNELTTINL